MHLFTRLTWPALMSALLLVACSPGSQPSRPAASNGQGSPAAPGQPAPARSVTVALIFEPDLLEPSRLNVSREVASVASAFLTQMTPNQESRPYLAATLPSLQDGTWKVLPDGRMETTYRLRADARWQDGAPVTAHDFVFAHQARMDPAFPAQRLGIERRLAQVSAVDDTTLFLEWRQPYRMAGLIAPPDFAPMHSQLLSTMYQEDRAAFVDGPHWREQFVGAGPYRVDRWEPGVEVVFRAHEHFVLGKPAIDRLVIKFIPDANTVVANLLGRTVDVSFSQAIGFPQGQSLEQAAWDGRVEYKPLSPRILEFQTRDWGSPLKAGFDPRVRRAALHAIDRQSIVENIYAGQGRVVYIWMPPSDPSFGEVDRAVTRYEYDPGRAAALLQDAGWTRAGDATARNARGESLDIPMQNQPNDFDQQEALVVAANWKALGIHTDIHRLSAQETRDNELRSTFAGISYGRRAFTLDDMIWTSAQVPTPENRWTGQNRGGYVNPELEGLWARALGTIDRNERTPLLIRALQVMSDDAVVSLTHQQPSVMAYGSGIVGPEMPDDAVAVGPLWNVGQWRWR